MLNLDGLTPADVQALRDKLFPNGSGLDPQGRSPIRPRQLHNLLLLPTKDDPRPTFYWSAEAPRNDPHVTDQHLYDQGKLLWSKDGVEIVVYSAEQEADKLAQGYLTVAPGSVEIDPLASLTAQLEALPAELRGQLVESQQKERLKRMETQLADLDPEALATILAALEPKKAAKKTA
jgi:hypothetical protein